MSRRFAHDVNRIRLASLLILPVLLAAATAEAQDRRWRDPVAGSFGDNLKWVGGVVPGATSTAVFGLNAGPDPFTVTFTAPVTNAGLRVRNQNVILDLSGFAYTINGQVLIGDTAAQAGSLKLANGGIACGPTLIGSVAGATGTLSLDQPGNTWSTNGEMHVGALGQGTLQLMNGATLNVHWMTVARDAGSSGSATVTGPDSTIQINDGLEIGRSGLGALTIEAGGHMTAGPANVGRFAGGNGSLTIRGTGSSFASENVFHVGADARGAILVEDRGQLTTGSAELGAFTSASDGTVTVQGTGSRWTNTGGVGVGIQGQGKLSIKDGALMSSAGANLGRYGSAVGAATIDGAGSRWDSSGWCFVGEDGDASLVVSNAGQMVFSNNTLLLIATGHTSSSSVHVTGDGSAVSGIGDLWCGGNWGGAATVGKGELTIENGGSVVCSGWAALGCGRTAYGTGTATVTVAGAGSRWDLARGMSLGWHGGEASIEVADGGELTSAERTNIAEGGGSVGSVTVRGTESKWNNTGEVYVGLHGEGSLAISDGGEVFNTGVGMGWEPGSKGTVTVTGGDSRWTSTGGVTVGLRAEAALTIAGGAEVTISQCCNIANWASSSADVTVSGTGTKLTSFDCLRVGINGNASLRIEDGATVSNVWCNVAEWGGSGTVTVDNATWVNSGGVNASGQGTGTGSIHVLRGGQMLCDALGIGGRLGSKGEVKVQDTGSFIWVTHVLGVGNWEADSTLTVLDDGVAIVGDWLGIYPGGLLQGHNGSVEVGEIVLNNGVIAPGLRDGNPVGKLTLVGNYRQTIHWADSSSHPYGTVLLDIGGTAPGTDYDVLSITDNADLKGYLDIRLVNGFEPSVGQTFQIIEYGSRTGTFNHVTGLDVGNGKMFLLDYGATGVALTVVEVAGLSAQPASLTLYSGFTDHLKINATSNGAPPQDVTEDVEWLIDHPNIVTVSSLGVVTAKDPGSTNIRAKFQGQEVVVPITVVPYPSGGPGLLPGLEVSYYSFWMPDFDGLTSDSSGVWPTLRTECCPVIYPGCSLTENVGTVFTGRLIVPVEGEYTFTAEADNMKLVIDRQFVVGSRGPRGSGSIHLTAGEHEVVAEHYWYRPVEQDGFVVKWEGPGIAQDSIPASAWAAPGVTATYYSIASPAMPTQVPDFSQYPIYWQTTIAMINDGPQVPTYLTLPFAGDVGAVITGYLAIPADGEYTLYLRADAGAKLYVDGVLAIEAHHGWATDVPRHLSLIAGLHAIRVDGYHRGYFHSLALSIEGPGIVKQLVPAKAFFHGTPGSVADLDGDGDVDLDDHKTLAACASGPAVSIQNTPGCKPADLDGDDDVDQEDFAVMQRCYSGENVAGNPACRN